MPGSGHVSVHQIPKALVFPHLAHVHRRNVTISDKYHMLLVIAQFPVMAQCQPQYGALADQKAEVQHTEKHQHPPGHLREPEHKQKGHQQQRIQRRSKEQRLGLLVEPHSAVGAVKSRCRIGHKAQHSCAQRQVHIASEGKRRRSGKGAEPHPIRKEQGAEHQASVREHIQSVEQPLILFYHRPCPPAPPSGPSARSSPFSAFVSGYFYMTTHQFILLETSYNVKYNRKKNEPRRLCLTVSFLPLLHIPISAVFISHTCALFRRTADCVRKKKIDFQFVDVRNMTVSQYALYKTAKSLYNESSEVSIDEFADPSLFGLEEFKAAVNAMLISRYGLSAVYLSHEGVNRGIL